MLLLDEPTSGMDPAGRRLVWNAVRRAVASGQAVLLTSHSMQETDTLCDNLAVLVAGRFASSGWPVAS